MPPKQNYDDQFTAEAEAEAAYAEAELSRVQVELDQLTGRVNEAVAESGTVSKNKPISIKRNTKEKSDKQILGEILGVVAKNKLKAMASKLLRKPTSNSSR